jgi:hypothetical protein
MAFGGGSWLDGWVAAGWFGDDWLEDDCDDGG